jgi:hypothetical protein
MNEPAEPGPEDVQVALTWQLDEAGGLSGELRVRNISAASLRLAGRPHLGASRSSPVTCGTAGTAEVLPPTNRT